MFVEPAGVAPEDRRDWAGLPEHVLVDVAKKLVAQTEAGWAAHLKEWGYTKQEIQEKMADRKRKGLGLFAFALVCEPWRKAQLKVGGPLRTGVRVDVIGPGQVELVKWALAEGCPRGNGYGATMASAAAQYGHMALVRRLIQEQGFAMDEEVMMYAAGSGNLELVQWLRGEGCPWDFMTCCLAVNKGHVEVLRWARENGCPWDVYDRDQAAFTLGYTDDFGNEV